MIWLKQVLMAIPKAHVDSQDFLHVVCGEFVGRVRVIRHLHPHHTTQLAQFLLSTTVQALRKYFNIYKCSVNDVFTYVCQS